MEEGILPRIRERVEEIRRRRRILPSETGSTRPQEIPVGRGALIERSRELTSRVLERARELRPRLGKRAVERVEKWEPGERIERAAGLEEEAPAKTEEKGGVTPPKETPKEELKTEVM